MINNYTVENNDANNKKTKVQGKNNKSKNKNKNKKRNRNINNNYSIIIYLLITIVIILLIITSFAIYSKDKLIKEKEFEENDYHFTLIQLSAQSGTQMMGYIIKTKHNQIIVVDGGYKTDVDNFMKYINKFGGRVDYWFLTHPHEDHASVLVDVIKNKKAEIGTVYASLNDEEWYRKNDRWRADIAIELINLLNNSDVVENYISPNVNDVYEIDGIKVEILGIRNPEVIENESNGNEQSMIIKFDTGKNKVLFLGDAEKRTSEKLLKNQKNKLKSDYVQMSHHGQGGATEELYDAINPKYCLWPTAQWLWDNNEKGKGRNTGPWRTNETKQWIRKIDVEHNYVAKDGDIAIEIE